MTKVPFFFKLYMLGTISFFEKSVNALKNNKVFRCVKTRISVSTFNFGGENQFFRIKIYRKSNAGNNKFLFINVSV